MTDEAAGAGSWLCAPTGAHTRPGASVSALHAVEGQTRRRLRESRVMRMSKDRFMLLLFWMRGCESGSVAEVVPEADLDARVISRRSIIVLALAPEDLAAHQEEGNRRVEQVRGEVAARAERVFELPAEIILEVLAVADRADPFLPPGMLVVGFVPQRGDGSGVHG